jgi:hypothetical protein
VGFPVATAAGPRVLVISAVAMRIGETRGAVVFVDNDRRQVYGQRYIDGGPDEVDALLRAVSDRTMASVRRAYEDLAAEVGRGGPPGEALVAERLRAQVARSLAAAP